MFSGSLYEAKERLLAPRSFIPEQMTVASLVDELRDDIATARTAGKSWHEISSDIFGGAAVNANTIRIEFTRARLRAGLPKQPRTRPTYKASRRSNGGHPQCAAPDLADVAAVDVTALTGQAHQSVHAEPPADLATRVAAGFSKGPKINEIR